MQGLQHRQSEELTLVLLCVGVKLRLLLLVLLLETLLVGLRRAPLTGDADRLGEIDLESGENERERSLPRDGVLDLDGIANEMLQL